MLLLGLLALAAAGFVALGVWQLERRVWKLDLIAQVDARVHAAAVAPPGPSEWPQVSAARDQYRRVQVHGVFLHDRETLTQAATALGAGYWVMTPLRTDQGFTVLINRGFVPPERRDPALRAGAGGGGEQTVTGLLRVTEPNGGFLRANDPASNRWRSRDVEAIARARGLADVAPYFIDADAASDPGAWPRGGLTVIRFPNSHLVYALTWFGMALLSLAGMGLVLRERRRGKGSDAT